MNPYLEQALVNFANALYPRKNYKIGKYPDENPFSSVVPDYPAPPPGRGIFNFYGMSRGMPCSYKQLSKRKSLPVYIDRRARVTVNFGEVWECEIIHQTEKAMFVLPKTLLCRSGDEQEVREARDKYVAIFREIKRREEEISLARFYAQMEMKQKIYAQLPEELRQSYLALDAVFYAKEHGVVAAIEKYLPRAQARRARDARAEAITREIKSLRAALREQIVRGADSAALLEEAARVAWGELPKRATFVVETRADSYKIRAWWEVEHQIASHPTDGFDGGNDRYFSHTETENRALVEHCPRNAANNDALARALRETVAKIEKLNNEYESLFETE